MSSEDFKSFVVTDPDILDEGIDISGIKRTTDTSPLLLGDLQPGLRYDPTLQSSYSDLLQYFSGGLPMLPDPPAAAPPATGGGGTGGGGQATTPITTPITTVGTNTPEEQRLIDAGIGVQAAPGQPVVAPGEVPVTQAEIDAFNQIPVNTDFRNQQLVDQGIGVRVGDTGPVVAPGEAPVTQAQMDEFNQEQQSTLQNILGQAGQTVSGALTQLGKIPGAIVDKVNQTVDIFGKKINVGKTLAAAAINQKVGGPVSLIFQAAEELLPERDPRQTKLDELYDVKDGTIQSGLMAGYNPVSGNLLNPTFGLQDAYDKRIDTIENTLKDKYNLSATDIEGIKAGTFNTEKLDTQTDLVQRLVDLENAKKKEADVLGITAAEDKRQGEAEMRQTVADAIRERDLGAGPRATTQPTTTEAPVTGVTRPGTVLGKPGIERFDDAEASIDMFDDTPPGASKTGTPIDALNPINRQQHFNNTEKLKDAVRAGEITPEEYNRLSAFDATKTMGLGPVTGTASAIGYQAVQTLAGDQNVSDFIEDTARNIQGVSGNITPEEQVKYQEIITGEKIYRDPILGMVDQPKKGTLAGIGDLPDISDEFAMFDLPEPEPAPDPADAIFGPGAQLLDYDEQVSPGTIRSGIETDQIGTFDADTFDDDVSFLGPQTTTTELTDSDFTAQDKQDIFNRERELENEYMEKTGQVPTEGRFLGQAINEIADKKITAPTSITPLEDDFESLIGPAADDDPAPTPTPTPTVPDFISGGGGGRDRDDSPAPSAPSFDPGGGFVDQGGEGEFGGAPPSKSSGPTYGPPSQSGGGGNGGGGGGGGKIVCTMMNESYGFGSFRNKIWLRHSKGLAPEYQKGYHKIFLPLVRLSKKNIVLKKVLEHIAVHRTIDIRQESRGKVHLLGRVYRKVLEPICYWVGKHG
jgi:hypothetical protein